MNLNENDVVNRKEGKILIESEIIKKPEYVWLKNLLLENEDNSIHMNQYSNLSDSYKNFFDSSLFKELYKTASNEWHYDHLNDNEERLECSLCGQKDTRLKFYIKNKFNQKVLNVGSTCINNFDNIRDKNGKTTKQLIKEWNTQRRKNELNNKYPGIISKIDNWYKRIDDLPTFVINKLEEQYSKIYNQLEEQYNKYIKNRKNDLNIAIEINKLVRKGDSIFEKILEDVEKKKDNEWYITKEIKEWCIKNLDGNDKIIEFLKEDGLVDWRTACNIYEPNLINKIVQKLKDKLKDSNINILKYDEKKNVLKISIKDSSVHISQIVLDCEYITFMNEYGGLVFEREDDYEDEREFVINNSSIKEISAMNLSVSNIRHLLNKSNIRVWKWDENYNEIVFVEKFKDHIIVNAREFINKFKKFIFIKKLENDNIKTLEAYIKEKGEIMSKEEYNDRIRIREKAEKAMHVDYSKFV